MALRYSCGNEVRVGDLVERTSANPHEGMLRGHQFVVASLSPNGEPCSNSDGRGGHSVRAVKLISRSAPETDRPNQPTQPTYYRVKLKGVECDVFDIEHALGLGMKLGTALKYMTRAGEKSADTHIEDLNKAIECIRREIAQIESDRAGKAQLPLPNLTARIRSKVF